MNYIKKFSFLLFCGTLSAEVIGIVGGGNEPVSGGGNVFLVNQDRSTTQIIVNSPGNPTLNINSVAINDSAISVMAGTYTNGPYNYAAVITSSGGVVPFANNGIKLNGYNGANINAEGIALAAGFSAGDPFLVTSNITGNTGGPGSFVTCAGSGHGRLNPTAINNLGWIVSGGGAGQNLGDGFLVTTTAPQTTSANLIICGVQGGGSASVINGVGLNDAGQGIAGGVLSHNSYGSLFNVNDPSTILQIPFSPGGQISSVSINQSGISIAGGQDSSLAAYAALIQPSGELGTPLASLPTSGIINSVEVTDGFGFGIIGGKDSTGSGSAYAAFVDAQGNVQKIGGLPTGPNANIASVSMNEWGIALIGGTADGSTAYAALVNPLGKVMPLEITGPPVQSVSIRNFLPIPNFPAPNLTGNNLIFAKYILQYARKKAVYFSPSLFRGTLSDALQSAAPTRNALPLFVADNNLFFLNYGLSSHLRHRRQFKQHSITTESIAFLENFEEDWESNDELFAFADDEDFLPLISLQQQLDLENAIEEQAPQEEDQPYTLWIEGIGAWASQKAQHQTVGFNPSTGGLIAACEKTLYHNYQVGAGFSYLFTHIHEEEDAGWSSLNQECLFVYGSCLLGRWYLDAALWGGLLQTDQERKIHMTGFNFKSTSNPGSWQFDPHLEVGYSFISKRHPHSSWNFTLDPFAMLDWANTWQESYKEKGHDPFNAGEKARHSSFLRFETGLRFYEGVRFDHWVLGLEQKGSYVYKNPFSVGKVQAFLVGSPGSFTVETLSSEESLGLLEVGFLFNPIDRVYPYGSIAYQGEFCGTYQSQQLTLELAWDF